MKVTKDLLFGYMWFFNNIYFFEECWTFFITGNVQNSRGPWEYFSKCLLNIYSKYEDDPFEVLMLRFKLYFSYISLVLKSSKWTSPMENEQKQTLSTSLNVPLYICFVLKILVSSYRCHWHCRCSGELFQILISLSKTNVQIWLNIFKAMFEFRYIAVEIVLATKRTTTGYEHEDILSETCLLLNKSP